MEPLSPSSMQVMFAARAAYLEAEITGFASPEGAQSALARIGAEADRRSAQRVLINCLGILGQTAPYDHQQLGQALARHLSGVRCALVTSPTKLLGVMGTAAKAAGADYRAFVSIDDAAAWLCG